MEKAIEFKDERSPADRIAAIDDYIEQLQASEHPGMDDIKEVCIEALRRLRTEICISARITENIDKNTYCFRQLTAEKIIG